MKKIILFLISYISISYASVDIAVSIVPEATIVKAISGDKAHIEVLVPKGASPHTYEPKPSQMIKLQKSSIYFAIGVEFEKIWLEKFKSQNPHLKIVNLDNNITKINNNPHIWLSTKNLSIMAKKIYQTLIMIDSTNKKQYKQNLDKYLQKLSTCHDSIQSIIKTKKTRDFMVFHPAFNYFAKEFGLTQIAIEIDGKNPSLKELLTVIKKAKSLGIKTIITSPEFSDKSAKIIANELNANILKISPLDSKICNTLKSIANSLK